MKFRFFKKKKTSWCGEKKLPKIGKPRLAFCARTVQQGAAKQR
jgi:hypothetical protein